MTEKEKAEINEMVEAAKIMAEHDPQSLAVAKAGFDALRAPVRDRESPQMPGAAESWVKEV